MRLHRAVLSLYTPWADACLQQVQYFGTSMHNIEVMLTLIRIDTRL
jgi:hypothetical protein